MAIVTVGITLVGLVLTARLGLVKSLKEVLYRSAGAHQTMGGTVKLSSLAAFSPLAATAKSLILSL